MDVSEVIGVLLAHRGENRVITRIPSMYGEQHLEVGTVKVLYGHNVEGRVDIIPCGNANRGKLCQHTEDYGAVMAYVLIDV